MADAIPPIKVSIVADTSGLKTGVDQATKGIKDMESSVKTASSGMSEFVTKLKTVGATLGIAFAGQQVLQFGKDVILASSNMAESLSKVQVVFGQNASAVEKWGNTSASAMGISKQAALEAAGTYGNLFQAFGLGQGEATKMSTSLVQLASDMASFNNTSIDDAILALRSGLSGETEPLKRFGVALNEVRLKQEALDLGLIKSTKEALTPAAKAQAAYALILHDTKLAQGDYARTADGTANTMRSLAAEFANAKVAIGDLLMPAFRGLLAILKLIVPLLTTIADFFKENGEALKFYAGFVLLVVGAFKLYNAILITVKVTQELYAVATTLMKGAQLASIASTNGLAASMLALNAAMRANPVGLIVTGVLLLGAAFVYAWKKSETFRSIVITAAQGVMYAFAGIIGAIGKLLGIIGKLPGMGWAKGLSKGAEDFANKINIAGKNLADLKNKVKAGYGEGAFTYGSGATDTKGGGAKGGGGLTEDLKKKLADYVKKAKDLQKDMQEVINEANEKAVEALNTRNEKMADANKKYLEREKELTKNYNEAKAEAQKRYDETKAAEIKKQGEAETAALKKLNERKAEIEKSYLEKTASLTKDYTEKVAEIRANAEEKSLNLTKAAAEKRQSIIQQSIDRLRTAFASKTAFDVGESLAGGGGVTSLLDKMKKQLLGAKNLQANAAALAGKGYTQTFIEQIVKQGPEMGNTIAEELLKASDASTKEMQALFGNIEDISNNGMNALAASMNAGGKLATEELMKSFNQVGTDLAEALAVVNKDMNESLAKTLKDYNEKTAEAEKIRKEALEEANKDYQETMAEIQKNYKEAMAEAQKTLEEARVAAKKTLDEGLAEAQKTLMEALAEAQKDYEKAIDEINKSTTKKIEDLKAKLAEVIALIAAISKAQAAAITAQTPVYTPITAATLPNTTSTTPVTGSTTNITTNVTGVNLSDPYATTTSVVNAIKFGNVVVPVAPSALAAGESGAIGAASIKARTITLTSGGGFRGAVAE